jgi:hypothetical protein
MCDLADEEQKKELSKNQAQILYEAYSKTNVCFENIKQIGVKNDQLKELETLEEANLALEKETKELLDYIHNIDSVLNERKVILFDKFISERNERLEKAEFLE